MKMNSTVGEDQEWDLHVFELKERGPEYDTDQPAGLLEADAEFQGQQGFAVCGWAFFHRARDTGTLCGIMERKPTLLLRLCSSFAGNCPSIFASSGIHCPPKPGV